MANNIVQSGSAVLAMITRRPPDRSRGLKIMHLDLTLPAVVETQLRNRPDVEPWEAAQLMWSVPAATYLDGAEDGWHRIPNVSLLLDTVRRLRELPPGSWPQDQQQLCALAVQDAQPPMANLGLVTALHRERTVELLNDVLLVLKYAALRQRRRLGDVADVYRIARAISAKPGPANIDEVHAWMLAPLVIPPVLAHPRRQPPPAPPDRQPRPDRRQATPIVDLASDGARAAIAATQRVLVAIDRISDALALLLPIARTAPAQGQAAATNTATIGDIKNPHFSGGLIEPEVLLAGEKSVEQMVAAIVAATATDQRVAVQAVAHLEAQHQLLVGWLVRPPTRREGLVWTRIAGNPVLINVAEMSMRMSRRQSQLAVSLAEQLPKDLRERLKSLNLPPAYYWFWPDLLVSGDSSPSYLEPAGRSDLLLVRQKTTGYRRAEISYIENVLVGETRARNHSDRVLSREETLVAFERETEESRDLQNTDRTELAREVNEVVQEDLRAEGSVQVTSRGPTKVVAEVSGSFEHSTEAAASTAEQYGRETIERAVRRTVERVRRETRSIFERETAERNKHKFQLESTAPAHVSGVYQYLEQVSCAKIFWYGERELYDLLVPEPAALIWQLALNRDDLHVPVEQPDSALFDSLTVDNIADKREEVIRAFGVVDLPEEPPQFRGLSASFTTTGGGDGAHYANSKDLQVPDGYAVESARFVVSAETEPDDYNPNGGVAVGDAVDLWQFPGGNGLQARDFSFPHPLPGPSVTVAFNADNYRSLIASFTLRLTLTPEGHRAWALEAYARVADRYRQMSREYEQAVVQATAAQPEEAIELPEGSRLRLQQMVRTELQRSVIDIMRNAPVSLDLITPFWFGDSTHPTVDLLALRTAEPEVRFLQQAFEWEHMSWIVYPYFWGRRSGWERTVVQAHPDPDFAAFLNAGAARVQVPVRPGFENLVKHFMETGEPYEGGDMPTAGEPGYVEFIDEQLTALGAPGEEIPWPPAEPREWEVVAPTSLLLLRSLAMDQLPAWDKATGAEKTN